MMFCPMLLQRSSASSASAPETLTLTCKHNHQLNAQQLACFEKHTKKPHKNRIEKSNTPKIESFEDYNVKKPHKINSALVSLGEYRNKKPPKKDPVLEYNNNNNCMLFPGLQFYEKYTCSNREVTYTPECRGDRFWNFDAKVRFV